MRVQYVTAQGAEEFQTVDDFVVAAPRLGLTTAGVVDEPHLNDGLQGLPKFKELAGPMGPHNDQVRYETWEAYEIYSS